MKVTGVGVSRNSYAEDFAHRVWHERAAYGVLTSAELETGRVTRAYTHHIDKAWLITRSRTVVGLAPSAYLHSGWSLTQDGGSAKKPLPTDRIHTIGRLTASKRQSGILQN